MFMKMRTTKPSKNKYYIRQASGGYNGAVQGKPTDKNANVLSNCVGYANGRFNEIIGENKCKYQLVCNAENFIEKAKALGLKISDKPVLGGIMVWQKGNTLSGNDGAGHVAIVEKIIDDETIYTSESAYGGKAFYNATRKNTNKNWGMSSPYKFRGCIINPAVKSAETKIVKKENKSKTLKVGSQIRIKTGANQYGTTKDFASKVYNTIYKVVEMKGNRVVFATKDGKTVMGAVGKSDCVVQ